MGLTLSSKLGLSLSGGRAVPGWVLRSPTGGAALFDADFANSRYFYNGGSFAAETDWLAAIGFSKSGITRATITPVVIGDSIVSNGDFSSGVTGWTAQGVGTIAQVAGQLELTGNGGNTPGFSQQLTSAVTDQAYRGDALLTRVGSNPSPQFAASSAAGLGSAFASVTNSSGTPTTATIYWAHTVVSYVGGRLNANPANGTGLFDDIVVRPVAPLTGWSGTGCTLLIKGTTPSAMAADKVALQIDDNSERNRVRVVYDTANHLRVVVTRGNTEMANLDLGTVASSADFTVGLSAAQNNFFASLNGAAAVVDGGGNHPGLAFFRIGRSFTGEAWDGSINRVAAVAGGTGQGYAEWIAGGNPSIATWGDSLTNGTGASVAGTRYPAVLGTLFDPDRTVYNGGVGGETSTQIRARMVADTTYNYRCVVLWAGRNNYTDTQTVLDDLAAMVAHVGSGRYVVMTVLNGEYANEYAGGVAYRQIVDLNAAIMALYPANYIDIRTQLVAAYDSGSPQDVTDNGHDIPPASLRSDNIHLNDAGYAIVADRVFNFITAHGW